MKKRKKMNCIKSLLVLASSISLVSCQQEYSNSAEGDFVNVSLSAGIPGTISTYSPSTDSQPGAFSHQGGALNVDNEKLDLRYILEVWTKEDTPRLAYRDIQIVDREFHLTPVTFNMRLQSLSYYFVFWADFVEEDSVDDLHYITDGNLQNIQYADHVSDVGDLALDEMDAYCAVEEVDFLTEGMTKNIVLQRPFGKLRLISTDNVDSGEFIDIHPVVATIDFKGAQFADSYNALTGKAAVSDDANIFAKSDFGVVQEDAVVTEDVYTGAYLLGFHYFLVTDQAPAYEIDVTVYGDEAKTDVLNQISLSSVPVSANSLTTVIGNFYSNEGSVTVIVDDDFDDPENLHDPENI